MTLVIAADRRIVRRWQNLRRVMVETIHPQLGELTRGWVMTDWNDCDKAADAVGHWDIFDQDNYEVGHVCGDYLDAEAKLIEATTWADELLGDEELAEMHADQADDQADDQPAADQEG